MSAGQLQPVSAAGTTDKLAERDICRLIRDTSVATQLPLLGDVASRQ